MAKITRISRFVDLSGRRAITVEMPEFLLRAVEVRLAAANEGAQDDEKLELEHLLEIKLAEGITLADVAHLERDVPGIGAAVSKWLADMQ